MTGKKDMTLGNCFREYEKKKEMHIKEKCFNEKSQY